MSAATLKQEAIQLVMGGANLIPRSHERGHIEAGEIKRNLVHFGGEIPRSHERGHIEAIKWYA